MLAGEQRRGRHHGHLFPRHRHHKGRAQGHFGFAESDIAADKAIHRPAVAEIGHHIGNGFFLILRLLIGETGAEFVIKPLWGFDRRKCFQFARGGNRNQLGRDFAHAFLHAGFALLPAGAAKPVKLGRAFIGAIARQKFDILHRQEQLAAVILQRQAIMRGTRNIERLEPQITADAVFDMGDEIAGREA